MAIKVVKEPREFLASPPENCFHCNNPTHYWHTEKDVPCCPSCAKQINGEDVPTKKEWIVNLNKKVDGGQLEKFLDNVADGKVNLQ